MEQDDLLGTPSLKTQLNLDKPVVAEPGLVGYVGLYGPTETLDRGFIAVPLKFLLGGFSVEEQVRLVERQSARRGGGGGGLGDTGLRFSKPLGYLELVTGSR